MTAAFLALAAGGTAACDSSFDEDQDSYDTTTYSSDTGSYSGSSGSGSSVSDSEASDDDEYVSDDGETPSDQVFYCADETGEVVEEQYCDDDSEASAYFLWHSSGYPRGLGPGTVLDGGDYFPAGDREARRSYKLPATGKVANGTVKTNVVGASSGGSRVSGTGSAGG